MMIPITIPRLIKRLLLLLPLLEIALFIAIGRVVGVYPILLFIVASGVFGFYLLKTSGMNSMRQEVMSAAMPLNMFSTISRTIAGVLFIIPGVITDCIACLLLIPGFCDRGINWLLKRKMGSFSPRSSNDDVVDAEFWKENESTKKDLQ